jgi:hypothetical protein
MDKSELLKSYSSSSEYQCRQAVLTGEAQALASGQHTEKPETAQNESKISKNTQKDEVNLNKERPKSFDMKEMSKSKSTNNFLNLSLDIKSSYVEMKSSLHNIAVLRSPIKRRSSLGI